MRQILLRLRFVSACCVLLVPIISATGCGPGGTPAPPEDVALPDEILNESEEFLSGEGN